MVLKNYIELQVGIPARMHFMALTMIEKDQVDTLTGTPMKKRSLYGVVDRLNGQEVSTTFSALAQGLKDQLEPFIANDRFKTVEFVITKFGSGFLTRYQVEVNPFRG